LLDGYPDDWPHDPSAWAHFAKDDRHRFAILTGVYERMLYVLLEVRDQHPLFDAPGTNPLDPGTFGDRVWLGFQDSQGEERQVFLAATAPGAVTARRIETGEYGQQSAPLEPRIRGAWQPMSHGYRIELRAPLSMLGNGFGVLVDDRDGRGADPVSYGTLRSDDLHTLGRLIVAAPELTSYLAQFMQPGLKLAASTPSGLALRLSRLRQASESALTRSGLVTSFPETDSRDELGDVARGFSTLLQRLNEYTSYLRTLAGKLAHEIRTPLTIVRSSLDNLESEQVPASARAYLTRARQGSERLSAILIAMGAATRVEEPIRSAEPVGFDLVAVLESAVAAYRGAFPGRGF